VEVINIERAVKRLEQFWQKQKIVSPPNDIQEILNFEFSKCIQMPDDFRRLFIMTNGMVNLYPNEMDDEGFLFYPLQELTTIDEEFEIEGGEYGENCIIFAEYMHKSWWYGVRFSKFEDDYEIGIIPSASKFKIITKSLAEFIQLYINGASILYEY
jgi:hypothetical protein